MHSSTSVRPRPSPRASGSTHAQLRDGRRFAHDEHTAGALAVALRDPRALARGVEALEEFRRDLGDHRLERDVPPVLARVERAVARHDPAEVAGPVRAQRERLVDRSIRAEHALDRVHRAEQPLLALGRERREDAAHLVARALVELPERASSRGGQPERLAPAVALVARAEHEPPRLEPAQQPRQVGSVEREVAGEVDRGDPVAVGKLEEDAGLRERERGGQQVAAQRADPLGVPAVEPADRLDAVDGDGSGHGGRSMANPVCGQRPPISGRCQLIGTDG